MIPRTLLIAAAALALAAGPALALDDEAITAAMAANQVGEQADGYLGVINNAGVSADVRARMNQLNVERRTIYTQRAQATNVSVDEYARSFACSLLSKNTPVGGSWRDEHGDWRRNTAGVTLPTYCPA